MSSPSIASSASTSSTPFRFAARTEGSKPSAIREILKVAESPEIISFAGGLPAPELFPKDAIAAAAAAVFAADAAPALQYGVTEGYRPLRDWISAHLHRTGGILAPSERILILHGSQQGLDLAAKVLLDPGDIVVTENPAYLGALQAFRSYQAKVIGLDSDDEGLLPDALEHWLRTTDRPAKFLYLNSSFQNPTGTSLSPQRRLALAQLAARYALPVLEDDPYGELRFAGSPQTPLAGLPGGHAWIYLGTSSKILAPGLRVAWLVTSEKSVFDRLVTAKQSTDLHTSTLTQRMVWETVRQDGFLDGHLNVLRRVYGQRRNAMLSALQTYFPPGCRWTQPDGGLFLWVTTPDSLDTEKLLPVALAEKVAFVPGAPFWIDRPVRNTLRLNFSNASEERIAIGIERLGSALGKALQ